MLQNIDCIEICRNIEHYLQVDLQVILIFLLGGPCESGASTFGRDK